MARVQSLSRWFEDTEAVELAFLQYMECFPSLEAVDKSLRCVCLRRTTTDGGEDESKVGWSVKRIDCTVADE